MLEKHKDSSSLKIWGFMTEERKSLYDSGGQVPLSRRAVGYTHRVCGVHKQLLL